MIDSTIKFLTGLAALVLGGLVAVVGLLHVIVVSQYWFLVFLIASLIGLAVLLWGGQILLSMLPSHRVRVSIERNG